MRSRKGQETSGGDAGGRSTSHSAPGKRTLTEGLEPGGAGTQAPASAPVSPVQRKDGPGAVDDHGVHAAAATGVSGPSTSLPHLGLIQRLFGRHDVSGIAAHTDDNAVAGAHAMGASAFATSNHVAFAGAPGLHTAAHEAAHVVQQRGGVQLKGGVGEAGDPYERHADAVADLVVQGRSAEALLDQHAGGDGAHARGMVQRQEGGGGAPAADPFEQGTFLGWPMIIVPDDHHGRLPQTNWIYRRYKVQFEALYATVAAGSGRIKITETGPDGTAYPGFQDKILKAIKRLMTTVPGRELIKNLEDGGSDVTIEPDPAVRASANATTRTGTAGDALRNADGTAGRGTTSTISIDPNQSNRTQRVFDRDGNEISFPLFINLGHEMIHAMHNQRGENERNNAATDADYTNREEELTIDGPGLSENRLRRSFGLTERHGHSGRTTADTSPTVSGGATGG